LPSPTPRFVTRCSAFRTGFRNDDFGIFRPRLYQSSTTLWRIAGGHGAAAQCWSLGPIYVERMEYTSSGLGRAVLREGESSLRRSELVCDPDLEKMLHQGHLKRNIQRATRGRRAASATSCGCKGKGIRSAWIVEPGKAILSPRHPIGPESNFKTHRGRPAKRSGRLLDGSGCKCPRKIVARGTV
jgi:hypothetical protein